MRESKKPYRATGQESRGCNPLGRGHPIGVEIPLLAKEFRGSSVSSGRKNPKKPVVSWQGFQGGQRPLGTRLSRGKSSVLYLCDGDGSLKQSAPLESAVCFRLFFCERSRRSGGAAMSRKTTRMMHVSLQNPNRSEPEQRDIEKKNGPLSTTMEAQDENWSGPVLRCFLHGSCSDENALRFLPGHGKYRHQIRIGSAGTPTL